MLGPTDYTPVRVTAAWDETAAFRAVRLALPPALARAHVRPGQVVKIRVPTGEGFFALASAPAADAVTDLLVKRGGKIADAIAGVEPGDALEVTTPFGEGFPVEEGIGRDVLLFGAGSGIAPIRAVVQHLLAQRDEFRRVTLFYGQRHGAEFAYRGEQVRWERGGVRVVLCPSRADDAWTGVRGRVQEVARALAFGGTAPEETVAFVAGMTAMVEDVRRVLSEAGIPPARVHANF
ncbi:ferredoxin reductase domain-containing protein [Anaeromyxobacter oryzisoli]|uniref:oxidoreductase n=1 Tax=Anaeromyxobacter oryzisoli TaxID=2925408 RepID=UPI001F5873C7|nr:oxidoreductase [Anaeromyxobacter sp. SG63]